MNKSKYQVIRLVNIVINLVVVWAEGKLVAGPFYLFGRTFRRFTVGGDID